MRALARAATVAVAATAVVGSSILFATPASAQTKPSTGSRLVDVVTPTWDSRDPLFIKFPNMRTPLTPDGAAVCLVPTPCVLQDDADDAVNDIKKINKPSPKGGSGGSGAPIGGGGTLIGGFPSTTKNPTVTVGPVEQVDK